MRQEPDIYDSFTALLREVIECLPNGFCILDPNFRPILANRIVREGFHNFFANIAQGRSYREAHFLDVRKALPDITDDQCRRISETIIARAREGKPVDLLSEDGRIFSTSYFVISGGCRVAIYVDMSALRKRKAELEALKAEAEAANQGKSAFLANMSHEIRTPLNGILGMAQAMAGEDLDQDDREQVEIILESGQTLNALLNDVLDLSKIEAGHMELAPADCNLHQILRRQYSLWLPRAEEKGINLELDIAPELSECLRLDPIRFSQCLANLISNAIKFTGTGEVRVAVAARGDKERVSISVSVSDTGIGMSEEAVAGLFTAFAQADASISRKYGGTGLGLVITRKLAEMMGGGVTVTSREGVGSTFRLTVQAEMTQPLERLAEKPRTAEDANAKAGKGKRILLVDDHQINRRVARMFLGPAGYDVTEAENGLQALGELEASSFDLVLLDIRMPVMDGLETLRRIRTASKPWSSVPVIALTADAMSGDRERYIAAGMNDYLAKPLERQALLTMVVQLLSSQQPENGSAEVAASATANPIERASVEKLGIHAMGAILRAPLPDRMPVSEPEFELREELHETEWRDVSAEYDVPSLMREAIQALPHPICIFDKQLRRVMVNQLSRDAFADYHADVDRGLSHHEATLASIRKNLPDASDEECARRLNKIMSYMMTGKPLDITLDGRTQRTIYNPMPSGGYASLSTDITDELERQEQMDIARRQADAANQAKSAFLANMSHEIRTPLNGILGMAQVLEQCASTSIRREQAGVILESGKNLLALLNDVLDLSKIDAGRMELALADHDVRQMLDRILHQWQAPALSNSNKLRLKVTDRVPTLLKFDVTRLEQCINNLLSNAIKFTHNGDVQIDVDAQQQESGVCLGIAIADTGIGMREELMRQLFLPFTQNDASDARRYGGTGLGLVITRRLAQLMGGDIAVSSRLGVGSVFTLAIKAELTAVYAPPNIRVVPQLAAVAGADRSRRRPQVLFVDDHPLNRQVGRLFLEPEGYEVYEAENGRTALEKLHERDFDLVLLDLHMPGLDGLETLRRIRGSTKPWRTIPVVALSADVVTGDRQRYLASGMDGYVTKPIEQRDLLAEIAHLLARAPHSKGRR